MPIYAYRCGTCGFSKDVLQKMSDSTLTTCPECKAESFCKQVTAAGFQLKGSGWYVTDFRGGKSGSDSPAGSSTATSAGESTGTSSSSASTGTTGSTSPGKAAE